MWQKLGTKIKEKLDELKGIKNMNDSFDLELLNKEENKVEDDLPKLFFCSHKEQFGCLISCRDNDCSECKYRDYRTFD